MIKALIFDFDGVIVESAEIKTRAFAQMFAGYPDKVQEIVDYHKKNAGVSRYAKFRYFYEVLLSRSLSAAEEADLGQAFSRIVLEQVLCAPFVPGTLKFLSENEGRYHFFIASGTPEEELKYILAKRKIDHFFRESHGAPKSKEGIINDILDRYSLGKEEVAFVGDAEIDRVSAAKAGVFFIARLTSENHELRDCRWTAADLTTLDALLQNTSKKR